MPVKATKNRVTGEETKAYFALIHHCEGGDWLLAQRKYEATLHQEMVEYQKACGRSGDRDGARFFKDEAARHRRRYNALLYIIPQFVCNPPADCKGVIEPWYWPLDLADACDSILSELDLHRQT